MFYFRADANREIGSGHVMRCLSIAAAMKDRGFESTFITADKGSEQLISRKGFPVLCLNSVWNDLDLECDQLIQLIQNLNIEHILIDSYFVTENYLERIRQFTKITYLDDLDKFRYPADNLINYNIYSENKNYSEKYQSFPTKLLLGCSYVPLRKEFKGIKPSLRKEVKDVLITTGGSDPFNVAGNLLHYLNREDENTLTGIRFHVVVGSFNPHTEMLKALEKQYGNVILHTNVTEMSKLISNCDLAVSAGGSTLYELCACGIASICYAFADNQLEGIHEFHSKDIIYSAGDIRADREGCFDKMEQRINQLISDSHLREEISARMQALVDGFGADRIIDQIMY